MTTQGSRDRWMRVFTATLFKMIKKKSKSPRTGEGLNYGTNGTTYFFQGPIFIVSPEEGNE